MNIGTILIIILLIAFIGVASVSIWIESKNPAPKGTTCSMNAEEQEIAYERFLSFLSFCYYKSNYTMEFLGIKEGFSIRNYGYDKCNNEFCCINFDANELVYCRNKETEEVKMFKRNIA